MTLVIAEAGVNHGGDMQLAFKLIEAAARSGADIVKFQTFQANALVTKKAAKADYQKVTTGEAESQRDMLKKLELTIDQHYQLIACCEANGIEFLSTAFDDRSIDLLSSLNLNRWKIPSGEITNLPYLRKIGSLKNNLILSTGMANLGEIEAALNVLLKASTPRSKICILHCTTEYPAPIDEVNLRALNTLSQAFGVNVGYSDHTEGISVPIAAVAMGAEVIEKHLTLDRTMEGPDHKASLEPTQFGEMVQGIRDIERALGDGIKSPTASELVNISIVRKSLVASKSIRCGEYFTADNITVKRPGTGISPMEWDSWIGRKATRNFSEDDLIQ